MREEWEPKIGQRVVDGRPDNQWDGRGATGEVVRCIRYGGGSHTYWRASVRWDGVGYVEHDIETTWLAQEGED